MHNWLVQDWLVLAGFVFTVLGMLFLGSFYSETTPAPRWVATGRRLGFLQFFTGIILMVSALAILAL